MKRSETSDALACIKKLRGASEDPEQSWIGTSSIRNLANPIERLMPRILTHPKNRLCLIDGNRQSFVASRLNDRQNTTQIVERIATGYRMVFGQHRQEDLITYLRQRFSDEQIVELVEVCRIDLSPPQPNSQSLQ
jgi:hypothetical protein